MWTSFQLLPKPVQIPSFVCSGTMVIEFYDKKKEKKMNTMDKMQKLEFGQKVVV